jgi:hypothetical protein
MTNLEKLKALGACYDSRDWARSRSGEPARRLYEECSRADWLVWLAARVGVEPALVMEAVCACVEACRLPASEVLAVAWALDVGRRSVRGGVSSEESQAALDALRYPLTSSYAFEAAQHVARSTRVRPDNLLWRNDLSSAAYFAGHGTNAVDIVREVIPWKVVKARAGVVLALTRLKEKTYE